MRFDAHPSRVKERMIETLEEQIAELTLKRDETHAAYSTVRNYLEQATQEHARMTEENAKLVRQRDNLIAEINNLLAPDTAHRLKEDNATLRRVNNKLYNIVSQIQVLVEDV